MFAPHVDVFHLSSDASRTCRRLLSLAGFTSALPSECPPHVMEGAGNGRPGVGSPSGGGIRVIDNVSCRRDACTLENPQVTTERDRLTAERQRAGGGTYFRVAHSKRMLTQTRVFTRLRASVYMCLNHMPKTTGKEEKGVF